MTLSYDKILRRAALCMLMLLMTGACSRRGPVLTFREADDPTADTLADWQNNRFVLIEVVDLKRDSIDISRVDPASIKTYRHAVTAPARATLYLGRTAMRTLSSTERSENRRMF